MANSPTQANIIYSDVFIDFDTHPIKKDLVLATNEIAVKNSIKNLVLTNPGERFFDPILGGGIRRFLFEPMSPQVAYDIKQAILTTIANEEPRARVEDVEITPNYDIGSYSVIIKFYAINSPNITTLNISLARIR